MAKPKKPRLNLNKPAVTLSLSKGRKGWVALQLCKCRMAGRLTLIKKTKQH
jgi:hypothetical protein